MKSIALCESSLVSQSENVKDLKEASINENGNEDVSKLKNGNTDDNVETKILTVDEESFQNGNKDTAEEKKSEESNSNDSLVEINNGEKVECTNFSNCESVSDNLKLDNELNNESVNEEEKGKPSSAEEPEKVNDAEEVETTTFNKEINDIEEKKPVENEVVNLEDNKDNEDTSKTEDSNTSEGNSGAQDLNDNDDNDNDNNDIIIDNDNVISENDNGEIGVEKSESGHCLVMEEDENKENRKDGEVICEEDDRLSVESNKLEIQVGNCQSIVDPDKNGSWSENPEENLTPSLIENEKIELEDAKEDQQEKEENKDKDKEDKHEEDIMEIDVEDELEQIKCDENVECNGEAQTCVDDECYLNKTIEDTKQEESEIESSEVEPLVSRKRGISNDEDNFIVVKKSKVDSTEEINSIGNSSRRSSSSLDADSAFNRDIDIIEPEVILREGFPDDESYDFNISKQDSEYNTPKAQSKEKTALTSSFLANLRGTLKNLTRGDLEELIVQKLCEVITERSNVGELRRKAQILEQDQEKWKAKVQSLTKLVREMEMVLKKYMNEVQKQTKDGNPRIVVPFKVTRSVGLQVSFYSSGSKASKTNSHHQPQQQKHQQQPPQQSQQQQKQQQSPSTSSTQNGLTKPAKVQAPKTSQQSPVATKSTWNKSVTPKSSTLPSPQRSPVPPLKKQKPLLPKPDHSTPQQSRPVVSQSYTPSTRPHTSPAQGSRHSTKSASGAQGSSSQQSPLQQQQLQNNNSKVIDLTDDDDKQPESTGKPSNSIRVVNHLQQQSQIPQNNNRFAYILPTTSTPTSGVNPGQSRQVLIATPTVPQSPRPMMCSMPPLLFKGGNVVQPPTSQPPMVNQSNRLYFPKPRHPAPLPAPPLYQNCRPNLKLLPPRPALKISKVPTGIVLSWNMSLGPEHAPISSYQLYAYQESNSPPSTSLWKKVGDVKALPLPMACTLTQFMSGHKYHFAVRAVDLHSRTGPFSFPGTIVLVK